MLIFVSFHGLSSTCSSNPFIYSTAPPSIHPLSVIHHPSIQPSIYPSTIHPSSPIYLPIIHPLSIHPFAHPLSNHPSSFIYHLLPTHSSINLPIHPSINLSIHPPIYPTCTKSVSSRCNHWTRVICHEFRV